MSDFIGISVDGIQELEAFLAKVPEAAIDAVYDAGNEYMLNVLRTYPPYRYVARKRAYPDAPYRPGWFSSKQFRYVMAAIRRGEITPGRPNRTQNLSKGWRIVGQGRGSFLANEVPYAKYLQSKPDQARQPALAGWKAIEDEASERSGRLLRILDAEVGKALRKIK
jgi:hypothetical protein